MGPMVERAARAVRRAKTGNESGWSYEELSVYAAIAAMEEPTEEIRDAITRAVADAIATGKQFDEVWRVGVRAALGKA